MQVAQTQHKVSEFLVDRHPYIEEAKSDKLEVCVALGRRGVQKLADILRDSTQTDAEIGSGLELLLRQLSTQEKKIEAIRNGVVAAATVIMKEPSRSPATRASAGKVLGSLAQVLQGRTAMKKAKTVPVLTNSCLDDDSDVRAAASGTLTHMTSFRDGWGIVMDTTRAVRNLVNSMDAHPASISVFANLTSFFDEGCEESLKQGVMPKIVAVMRETKSPELKRFAAMTLRNIVNNDTGKEKAIRYGAVEAAAELLRDEDALVRAAVAGAIQTICVNQTAKPMFLDCAGAVAAMAALLRDSSSDVQHNATLAIRNISDLPAAKAAFVKALVGDLDLLMRVFGSGSAQQVCELLVDEDAAVRGYAAVALAEFTKSEQGRRHVVDALHVVKRLAGLLIDDALDSATQRKAAAALAGICGQFNDAKVGLRNLVVGSEELRAGVRKYSNLQALMA